MHGQVKELLTNYGKLDLMWFDFSYGNMSGETWKATKLIKMIREIQPHIMKMVCLFLQRVKLLLKCGFNCDVSLQVPQGVSYTSEEGQTRSSIMT
jgi:hypothetical protein